ncbi:MAG: hypothetical protein U1D30_21945 [Planctomycetota bacterium]
MDGPVRNERATTTPRTATSTGGWIAAQVRYQGNDYAAILVSVPEAPGLLLAPLSRLRLLRLPIRAAG